MNLIRPFGKGHPSYLVWQEWADVVNDNQYIFNRQDDFDTICDKLNDILKQNGIKYISGDSVIRTAAQIASILDIM